MVRLKAELPKQTHGPPEGGHYRSRHMVRLKADTTERTHGPPRRTLPAVEKPCQVRDQVARVVFGPVNEARLSAAKQRQAECVEAGRIHDSSVVTKIPFLVEHWNVQPTVVRTKSRRPHYRPNLSAAQIDRQARRRRRPRRLETFRRRDIRVV